MNQPRVICTRTPGSDNRAGISHRDWLMSKAGGIPRHTPLECNCGTACRHRYRVGEGSCLHLSHHLATVFLHRNLRMPSSKPACLLNSPETIPRQDTSCSRRLSGGRRCRRQPDLRIESRAVLLRSSECSIAVNHTSSLRGCLGTRQFQPSSLPTVIGEPDWRGLDGQPVLDTQSSHVISAAGEHVLVA